MRATAISPIGATKRVDRFKRKPEPIGWAQDLLDNLKASPLENLSPNFEPWDQISMQGHHNVSHHLIFNKHNEILQETREKVHAWIRRHKI